MPKNSGTCLIERALLGAIFDMFVWTASVAGIRLSQFAAGLFAIFVKTPISGGRLEARYFPAPF